MILKKIIHLSYLSLLLVLAPLNSLKFLQVLHLLDLCPIQHCPCNQKHCYIEKKILVFANKDFVNKN